MSLEANFVRDRQLTALAIKFTNPTVTMIADKILPKSKVGTQLFSYTEFPAETFFRLPDTTIGPRGEWPTSEIKGIPREASTKDAGHMMPISNDDMKQAAPGTDPRADVTERCAGIVEMGREVRVASKVFSAATYPAANKVLLAGANQFSDPTSNPLTAIMTAFDSMIVRPNKFALGAAAWNSIKFHPKLVKAIRNESGEGIITREQFAELLEIEEVIVGAGWIDLSKPGEASNRQRLWGKHGLGFYQDPSVSFVSKGLTFGLTAEYETRVAGVDPKPRAGLRGGVEVYVGESLAEVIVAPGAAFFFENIVA